MMASGDVILPNLTLVCAGNKFGYKPKKKPKQDSASRIALNRRCISVFVSQVSHTMVID